MKTVTIDTNNIKDTETFHEEFKRVMGFPDFYGMNMDAWIDCMSDIGGRMMAEPLNTNEPICIELQATEDFSKRLPEIVSTLIECTAFVNQSLLDDVVHADNGKYIVLKFL